MSAHRYLLKIRVIAFRLGKLLSNNPREREVGFITLVEKKSFACTGRKQVGLVRFKLCSYGTKML